MEYKEPTEKVIGCAYRVYNKMGDRFLESVYDKCLMIELRNAGLSAESQIPIHVEYEGETVGGFVADVVIEGWVIVELKSVKRIVRAHEIQVANYLAATHKEIGLILNFSPEKVEVKRKVRDLKVGVTRILNKS